jgi:broad specificity phosphatase PhoE
MPVAAVYSSPLSRAMDTALAIASRHGLDVHSEPDLREIDVGEMEGMELHTLTNDFSAYLLGFKEGNGGITLPGGESLSDVYRRTWAVVQGIVQRGADPSVIVSHYFVTLSAICAALDMPVSGVRFLRCRPASVSILDFSNKGVVLTMFNHTCHLDATQG